MANQPETTTYDAGVYQLQTTDPVQGGVGGTSNTPLLNLANRTAYLKAHMDSLEAGTFIPPGVAPLNSPTFTGTVSGPTPSAGDNTTKFATTAFVQFLNAGVSAVTGLTNANVTLTAAQYGAGIISLAGTLTGNINIVFPINGKWIVINNTSGAFTVTCKTVAGTGVIVSQGKNQTIAGDGTNIIIEQTDFKDIVLTGAPTTPTQATSDNSTKIASTAFVQSVANPGASLGSSGYVKFTNGHILQWVNVTWVRSTASSVSMPTNCLWNSFNVTYPIAFPTRCLGVHAGQIGGVNDMYGLCAAGQPTNATMFATVIAIGTPAVDFGITLFFEGH